MTYWPHSQDYVDEPEPETPKGPADHVALDGTQACIRGCTDIGEHLPGCPCTTECPTHDDHCQGCAPRPAYETSLLCGHCFHRKLRSPLRRVPALVDWLNSRKAGLHAAVYDSDRVSGSTDAPLPFNPDIVDHLAVMALILNGWAKRTSEQSPPAPGPTTWNATGSAAYLEQHSAWIAEQAWVVEMIRHLGELEDRTRELAPWQPVRHRLPLPCTKCEHTTLVLFGGDDWVTCTNLGCDHIIGWFRYQSLSRAIGRIYENEPRSETSEEGEIA